MRPIRPFRSLLAAAAALLVAWPAWSQTPLPQPSGTDPALAAFQGADTNKDGVLSREEAAKLPTIASRFDELDKNKDGVLSFEEFRVGWRSVP